MLWHQTLVLDDLSLAMALHTESRQCFLHHLETLLLTPEAFV